MRNFVLTATYELRVSRKSHLRDHPKPNTAVVAGGKRVKTTGNKLQWPRWCLLFGIYAEMSPWRTFPRGREEWVLASHQIQHRSGDNQVDL